MAGAATVEKALDVLFHLHGAGTALRLTEIGRDLALPKSSCHRLLSSLVERGVVERDEGGRYQPGLALLSLGLGAQSREPVVRAARPVLEGEAVALGETVFLVARRRGVLRVLDKFEGSGFLRAAPDVGDAIPADVTAAGQLYRVLADPAEASRSKAGPSTSSAFSPESGTSDREALRRGFAVNRDAWIEGLSVLAVPVWQDRFGEGPELVATLALGAASVRFDALGVSPIAERLQVAAETIRDRLGVRSPASRRARRRHTEGAAGSPKPSSSEEEIRS